MSGRQRSSRKEITLARALSKFGCCSRTMAASMIAEGRVGVNGRRVSTQSLWVDPAADRITVDGKLLKAAPFRYLLMHKPPGVITTRSDERGRRTVFDLLPDGERGLFPVGRLDKETTGLLLFTNDTRLGSALTSPDSRTPKTYAVTTVKPLRADAVRKLETGLAVPGLPRLLPCVVRPGRGPTECIMTIVEGKNRQIRRMMESLGYAVVALHRSALGPLVLGDLPPGAVRRLRPHEVDALVKNLEGR